MVTEELMTWTGAGIIVILIGVSAFFSSSEIAMFSLPSHRVDALVEEGLPGADMISHLKSDPHRLLVTILVGNNLVNIAMTSIATTLLGFYFGGATAAVLSTLGITAVVLLFGESVPKSYAIENTETWSRRVARPLKYSEYLLLPLVVLFDYLTKLINSITGGEMAIESTYITRDEIQGMIETGERQGVLNEDEHEMLQRIFRFNNTIAKEVMTPRLDMTAVPKTASVDEAIETLVHSGHERVPVYEKSLDNVVGIIHIRDLIRESTYGENSDIELDDVIQPTLHIPESKNADELLAEMRENRIQMVIVIDEFGTTEGLITMEDMVEKIVGDILEGEEEEPIEFLDTDTAIVQGKLNIDEINDELDIELPEGEEFETVAGFIFNRAGRLVEEDETIAYDGVRLRVERVEDTRILNVRVSKINGVERDATETPTNMKSQ
nr:hemolysin family protein [Natrialba asiatica]